MARSYERSLLIRGGFSCFNDTLHREAIAGGVLVTVGVCLTFAAYPVAIAI